MQRIFDIFFGVAALIVLMPVFIPTTLLLLFTGEGEIFYRQDRIGRNGNVFSLLKFATMLKNSPNIGTGTITITNDPRVLPVGRFLRKTKINELPQLLNIIKGDMSVIGPRPLTEETFSAYPENLQSTILEVRPGLSGVGSVVFRDEEKLLTTVDDARKFYNENIAPYKGKLECWYVKNQNISLYFLLIFMTMFAVLFNRSGMLWRLIPSLPPKPQFMYKSTK
jgi:lipopolysaccharide/colanic/teichoic acid biosynthesis glycosyltransferase